MHPLRSDTPLHRFAIRDGNRTARIPLTFQALELRTQIGGMLIAQVAVLFEGPADDVLQFPGDLGVQPHRLYRNLVQNGVENSSRTVSLERLESGGHFVQYDAEGKEV